MHQRYERYTVATYRVQIHRLIKFPNLDNKVVKRNINKKTQTAYNKEAERDAISNAGTSFSSLSF